MNFRVILIYYGRLKSIQPGIEIVLHMLSNGRMLYAGARR